MTESPHPLYTGGHADAEPIIVKDEQGNDQVKHPIRFQVRNSETPTGDIRDQTKDAAEHMRYAATLRLPELGKSPRPRLGRAIIVGGGPTLKTELENIRALARDPCNAIIAVNWSHTWLINNGIIPQGCVFFEIDAEPDSVLKAAHPDVTYFICSHCHQKSFDELDGRRRVLWHSVPNSPVETEVSKELYPGAEYVGGGISTFTRTMTVALFLGYRHIDLFGCDGSYPEAGSTHVEGYETVMDSVVDGMDIWGKSETTGEVRKFKTLGYLALQVEEFKVYCQVNHQVFSLRVHGDSLMRWVHKEAFPDQYMYPGSDV